VAYALNLIDTPGHVDFQYEVSRSLAACEGALLLVDAAQGIEAQTMANAYKAVESNLTIVPIINKIDLQQQRADEVIQEMEHTLAIDPSEVLKVSAKFGVGIDDVFEAIINRIPAPEGRADAPLRALIFDSMYTDFRGVITYVRLMDGRLTAGDAILMLKTGKKFEVVEVGIFTPKMRPVESLSAGEVGYIVANIKSLHDVKIGDTVTQEKSPCATPLPGYREPKPMVFCGLYPVNPMNFQALRTALEKLSLNDSSFSYVPETSKALGLGFRCGFLGLLHMEIIQERLERESNIDVIQTAPNVTYEILTHDGKARRIENPAELPDAGKIREFREPIVRVSLIIPAGCIGAIMQLAEERRGRYVKTEYLSELRVMLEYDLPLGEIIFDFYDKLKSGTKGYGTMDYHLNGFAAADLVKMDVLVAGDRVDALSCIVHRDHAYDRGRRLVKRLRQEIARHLFEIAIQAAIGNKVIARETVRPLSKNVTGKCYGGDITRKRKLWAKQREGKKRMKRIGTVDIPQEAFLAVLSVGKED
jgi:GTP-binding protein LepA